MALAFDTETTGLRRPDATQLHLQPCITEIYICKFDENFKVYDEFESYVKPPVPIPEEITQITGITNQMVSKAPTFVEIYDDLCEFVLGETDIFAHNCSFDIDVLMGELERIDAVCKFPWPVRHHCTVELSYPINNKRMKLGDLHKLATGTELLNAHRAKSDVHGMVRCIEWLSANGFVKI